MLVEARQTVMMGLGALIASLKENPAEAGLWCMWPVINSGQPGLLARSCKQGFAGSSGLP